MKILEVAAMLGLAAIPLLAQSTTIDTMLAGAPNQGCSITTVNPCASSLVDTNGNSAGFLDVYIVRQTDGSFAGGEVRKFVRNAQGTYDTEFRALDFTGTGTDYTPLPGAGYYNQEYSAVYSGDYSAGGFSGHIDMVVIKRRYLTAFHRFITTYRVDSGTFTENTQP